MDSFLSIFTNVSGSVLRHMQRQERHRGRTAREFLLQKALLLTEMQMNYLRLLFRADAFAHELLSNCMHPLSCATHGCPEPPRKPAQFALQLTTGDVPKRMHSSILPFDLSNNTIFWNASA